MKRFLLTTFILVVTTIVFAAESPEKYAGYKQWKPTTDRPYTLTTSLLCAPSSSRPVEKPGPHAHRQLLVYVSPEARKAYDSKKDPFPIGTVIVKEKLDDSVLKRPPGSGAANLDNSSDKKPPELGVMIKDKNGWEFIFVRGDGKRFSGKETLDCAACHLSAKHDFVFSSALAPPQ
jgi:hypothetical protein